MRVRRGDAPVAPQAVGDGAGEPDVLDEPADAPRAGREPRGALVVEGLGPERRILARVGHPIEGPEGVFVALELVEGLAHGEGDDRIVRGLHEGRLERVDRERVLAALEEKLAEQYPDVKWVSWREFGTTHGVNEKELLASLPQRFRELGVDAAISCMAC